MLSNGRVDAMASLSKRFVLMFVDRTLGGSQLAERNEPRRTERVQLRADIDFRRPGDHRYRVNILDFSPEGCRMEVPVSVVSGDRIWISLPGIESIQAEVCWVKEWIVGVEFARPLYPAVFELVRDRMKTAK
jgi:hypothetical protein